MSSSGTGSALACVVAGVCLLTTAVEANVREYSYRGYQDYYNSDYYYNQGDYQGPDQAGLVAPSLVECAIQFFATGRTGHRVRVRTTRHDDYAVHKHHTLKTTSARFDSEKAVVSFEGAIDEHNPKKVDVHLHADFIAPYFGCTIDDLSFGHVIDGGGSDAGSGNCYTIQQTCPTDQEPHVYATVYADIYCKMPYAAESIKMKYVQTESGVDEVKDC